MICLYGVFIAKEVQDSCSRFHIYGKSRRLVERKKKLPKINVNADAFGGDEVLHSRCPVRGLQSEPPNNFFSALPAALRMSSLTDMSDPLPLKFVYFCFPRLCLHRN